MEIVTKIAPIALALIMLGLGLGLTTQDFARVLKTPKDFLTGFISRSKYFKSGVFYLSDNFLICFQNYEKIKILEKSQKVMKIHIFLFWKFTFVLSFFFEISSVEYLKNISKNHRMIKTLRI